MSCCWDGTPVVPHTSSWIRVVLDRELPALPCRVEDQELTHGQMYVVDTPDGQYVGRISVFAPPVFRAPRTAAGRLLRPASPQDEARARGFVDLEREIEAHLRRRTRELGIELRPLKARIPLSGRKAVVYFTAEKRVDFRPLLRELGRRFRRRVEMRPLGVRDGARVSGGIGPCGRSLCCATHLDRFHSVTVKMAKRQNLSLNPAKISGMCSRLMCCLAYEVDLYPAPERRRRSRS